MGKLTDGSSFWQAAYSQPERQINFDELEDCYPGYKNFRAKSQQHNITLVVLVPNEFSSSKNYNASHHSGNSAPFYHVAGSENDAYSPHSATGPHVGKGPQGYNRSADEKIWEHVCGQLEEHGELDASGIVVEVENEVVTISGTVADAWQKKIAGHCCESVRGVWDVNNRLSVL